MTTLDRRLNAFRPDLADIRLTGQVEAERFAEGKTAEVTVPVADLRGRPAADAGLDTQLLLGDPVRVFEERDGWAWVQAGRDSYVGYMRADSLGPAGPPATHVVGVPRSFLYPGPDMKLPHAGALSLGSRVAVTGEAGTRGTRYLLLPDGRALVADHLLPLGEHAADYVTVAETLLHTPYLWGGASAFGIDCSGLVQLSLGMAGRTAPRDSDMQARALGTPLTPAPDLSDLKRGDLVFWKGHVGIMTGADAMIHANGYTMSVAVERLSDAVRRIRPFYGEPTGFRRP
jgi:cell wall-associated NlpC family hydrolase